MMDINELKLEVKNILVEEGLGPALKRMKGVLPENSKAYNEIILLEADLKDANLKMVRGSIGQNELDVKYNQLRERFLTLVEDLEPSDLEAPSSEKKSKHGSLLYQIPGKMEIEKEARCRVRIAYDEAALIENIELTADTKIKDVRIAEVMEVELIDPAETPAFSIRTFNRQEQFIEKDEYTEWIFFVKPLREGQFPLMLRVSVIEKVGEKERVRDIVMEETVVIVAEPVQEEAKETFKSSGIVVGEEEAAVLEEMVIPKKGRKPLQSAALALVALVAFSSLTYAAVPGFRMNIDWLLTAVRDSRDAYQRFAEKYPESSKAALALGKIEDLDWNETLQDPTLASLEQFIDLYPESPYAGEAIEKLMGLNIQASLQPATRRAIENYLAENPNSSFMDQARDLLALEVAPPPIREDSTAIAKPEVLVESNPAKPPKPGDKDPGLVSELNKDIKELIEEPKPANPITYNSMILVKGGSFTMGCTPEQGDDCDEDENPAHEVAVGDFYMGRQEVTNAEFCTFLNAKGNQEEGGVAWINLDNSFVKIEKKGNVFSPKEGFEKYPVIAVSWYGARAYCTWMSETNGARFRLPTEAEWEYAARGGNAGKGHKYAGSDDLSDAGWFVSNAGNSAKPVGAKSPNELGIYDLSGNVWEWCSDWFGTYAEGASSNPQGASKGTDRVRRGGCWRDEPDACRVSNRSSSPPSTRIDYIGFRVVRIP
ncbi:MAG: SUMF1/EgtB/PvdO family nonheme iron enzyme [Lewinellaceae bacterium]|nr:SUMF1/EgtB/PvdO family nonheme iron enzyme [Lewinellaceae bacterium]